MSRIERSRPNRIAKGIAAAAAALLLAGCGAGQLTGTSTQGSSSGGANGSAGNILVRDAEIEFGTAAPAAVVFPAGASAPLMMHIVNQGYAADTLVSASSPIASSVQVGGATELPGGQALLVGTAPELLPGTQATQLTLVGLTEPVRAGLTYPVELTFRDAGRISLNVPVANPATPREPATE
ncbi:copper chaperone PCu(A)C [Pseudonocardia sp.]|uniref:copper chaperone PCu(A)C n=1 Tax=Pseudonocardia sp. TaxID=60912 RepID=UPI003D0FAB0D